MARSSRRLGFAFAAALALPALVACNAIIGLDDFSKGLCSGGRCDAGAEPDTGSSFDAATDAPTEGGQGADPVSWARWQMPNYDAGADSGLVRPLSYAVSAGELKDNYTQLSWKDDVVPGGAVSYDAAVAACSNLPGSWRLPKRIEAVTLLDFGQTRGVLADPRFKFANVAIWTSSEVRPFTGGADQAYWTVSFANGVVTPNTRTLTNSVLCVKAK